MSIENLGLQIQSGSPCLSPLIQSIPVELDPLSETKSVKISEPVQSTILGYLISVRCRFSVLLCAALYIVQFMNMSLGMTIICMVEEDIGAPPSAATAISNSTAVVYYDENDVPIGVRVLERNSCGFFANESEASGLVRNETAMLIEVVTKLTPTSDGITWSAYQQGLVLSAINWGRLVTPFLGQMVDRVNAKVALGFGVLVAGFANACIPICAGYSYELVILFRILLGLADAVVQPAVNRLLPLWTPKEERNMALSIVTGGRQLAVLTAFPLAGILCQQRHVIGGWPLIFYFSSACALIWFPLWIFWASQNPQKHRKMSSVEKNFISIGTDSLAGPNSRGQTVPWRKMLTSPVFWSNIGAILCHEAPLVIIFLFLPTFLKDVLNFDSSVVGLYSGIPAAAFLMSKFGSSFLADFIHQRAPWKASRTLTIRYFNTVGCIGLAGFLTLTAQLASCRNRDAALCCIILAVAFAGMHTPGCLSTLFTMAPPLSGTLSGVVFFLVSILALINPIAVKHITSRGTLGEWAIVLETASGIAFLPAVFFNIWGSAEPQFWTTEKANLAHPVEV